MAEEILINVTPQETRVAYVENGALQEIAIERSNRLGLVGNIYLGRVSRVLPGMGAAFLDVGLDRTAFLHASDIVGVPAIGNGTGPASIDHLLRAGQDLLVQVNKEPLGTKGARLTTQVSIASRYLVFLPNVPTLGVSQRIDSEGERQRLRQIVQQHAPHLGPAEELDQGTDPMQPAPPSHGYIIRTAADGADETDLRADMLFLQRLWSSILERRQHAAAPAILYEDLPLVLRTIRDSSTSAVEKIRVDSQETCARVNQFAGEFCPALLPKIEHYQGARPIFELYGIEDEIQRALQRRVELKSGGHVVIDQTEAMTTVDVNTGGFVGHRNLEETIFKTNLEAAQAIARQLRLRNLGGIIIVDFIDMQNPEHCRQVLRALEKHLERDHSKTLISDMSALGLVQITRKRTRESLEHVLCEPCPACRGRGTIKTAETVCFEVFREILREARQYDAKQLLVVAAPVVANMLLEEESSSVAELEAFIGIPIRVQTEVSYTQEQYDVVLV
ncbi:MAG: ribonuclease G [Gammaproteobacteria bacterium]|nr:ribonuclease G [Gammaproteobacteria bacterium]